MLNVFEALKSEGLVYQDPNDPSGSTWLMSEDADKVVEKVEKLIDYSWKTGRMYQLGEFLTNKRLKKRQGSGGFKEAEDLRAEGYNQAINDFETLVQDEQVETLESYKRIADSKQNEHDIEISKMRREVQEVESGVVYCVSPEVQELTKDIPCPWCPAKSGQSCFIQISPEEQELLHKNYRPGSDYIPERIHLSRWKQKI